MLYVLTRRRGANRRMLRILNAPEECPHGTHTSGTVSTHEAPTREYTHKHPQTQTNTQSTLYHGLRSSRPSPIIAEIATHRRTSTRPTAGGWSTSPPSRSTRSLMPDRARRRSRPPPVRRAPRPAPRRPTCRSRRTEPWTRCRLHRRAAVRACAAGRTPPPTQPRRAPPVLLSLEFLGLLRRGRQM